jgi:twitching motility protein PilT
MGAVLIDKLLQTVINLDASDLHIVCDQKPVVRMDGHLRLLETKVLDPDDTTALMKSITPERNQQELQEVGGTDFGFAFGDQCRFRVSVFKQRGKVSMVLRRIPNKFLTMEEIGLPPTITNVITRPRGLFLVTGPTGSGKTTTLACMVNWLNHNFDHHIITIEDPIEYYHPHRKSIINQREIGVDVPSFPEALRRGLRMDPDVMLVGEMRDLETISAAITLAETGHIVFGTLHTSSAEGTVNRIIDVFPKEQQDQIRTQLSVALIGVLCQALLPRKPKGRVAAFEFLVVTPAIANLIRENKVFRLTSEIQTGRKHGMRLLDDSLFDLWKQDLIDRDDAIRKANHPADLRARVERAEAGRLEEEELEEPEGEEGEEDEDWDEDDEAPARGPRRPGRR